MMTHKPSFYQQAVEKLERAKCPHCSGLGKVEDADFGDIYYNEWLCKYCNGTGFKNGGDPMFIGSLNC